jgi:hypothetical protein
MEQFSTNENVVIKNNEINSKTQARKGLISYYKTNGITSLKRTHGCRTHCYCKNV